MKLATAFHPAPTLDQLQFNVICELTARDERLLKPTGGKLEVDFMEVPTMFPLHDARGLKYSQKNLTFKSIIVVGKKWELMTDFPFIFYSTGNHRLGIVLTERIKNEIIYAMIQAAPLAAFTGIVKNYDVEVETPKELMNFEHWRRSVLVRGS